MPCFGFSSPRTSHLSHAESSPIRERTSLPVSKQARPADSCSKEASKGPSSTFWPSRKRPKPEAAGDGASQLAGTGVRSGSEAGPPAKQACLPENQQATNHAGECYHLAWNIPPTEKLVARDIFDSDDPAGSEPGAETLLEPDSVGMTGFKGGFLPSYSNLTLCWRRNHATLTLTCFLSKLLFWLQQLAAAPASPYLQGNYESTPECAPVQLEVEGLLPKELNGAYVRNGPNPVLPATGKCNW